MSELQKANKTPSERDIYICPECGCQMMVEDDGMLICPECGISMSIDEFDSTNS